MLLVIYEFLETKIRILMIQVSIHVPLQVWFINNTVLLREHQIL